MFSDPQSVTISGAAKSLPRVSSGEYAGTFRASDGAYILTIKNSFGKKDRTVVSLEERKIGANPLDPSRNQPYSGRAYLVLERPSGSVGFTAVQLEDLIKGLTGFATPANITKIVGAES